MEKNISLTNDEMLLIRDLMYSQIFDLESKAKKLAICPEELKKLDGYKLAAGIYEKMKENAIDPPLPF